jgi:SAM-dependent methyltransferase
MVLPEKITSFSVPDEYLLSIINMLKLYPVRNILDFGSGRTSITFKKYCPYANLFCIESDKQYYKLLINKYPYLISNLFLVDNTQNENVSYYNQEQLNSVIKNTKFDLISVDGPIGYGVKNPRQNILTLIDQKQLNEEFLIYIHDTNRQGEQRLITDIKNKLSKNEYSFSEYYPNVPYGCALISNIVKRDGIICPCCGNTVNKARLINTGTDSLILNKYFIIGAGRRQVVCPYCRSNDRSRLIFLYLKDFDFKGKNILHVSPENEINHLFKDANLHECICNYSEPYDKHRNVKNVDICDMSCYDDNTFDFIICNHVLEHVIDENKALSELHRVLKSEGKLILQVPLAIGLENTLYKTDKIQLDDASHKRLYGDNYQSIVNEYGFTSEKIYLADKYKDYGLNPLEYVTAFTKK